jgi:cell division protein FtsL
MARIAGELRTTRVSSVPLPSSLPRLTLLVWFTLLTLLVGVVAASYLAYTGNIARANYDVQQLQFERDQWRMRNDQLRVELAKVHSLTWVEHEAVTRLNMQRPVQLTHLQVSGGQPAAAAGPDAGRR